MSIKLATVLIAAAALSSRPVASPPREFRIDAGHSEVSFAIGFLGRLVKGRFDNVQGTIVFAPAADGSPAQSGIAVVIETGSINTGSKHRDEHLRSSDFFDAGTFPRIVFQSQTIRKTKNGFIMSGPLTMHGVTKIIEIPFQPGSAKPVEDPHGSNFISFVGTLKIARKDFGILGGSAHNDWFDQLRSSTMADTALINIDIEGWATDFSRSHAFNAALKKIESEGVASLVASMRARYAKEPKAVEGSEWELGQIGAALLSKGMAADAVEILRMSNDFFPKSASARAQLANAYEAAGQKAEARNSLNEALTLDPFQTQAMELKRRLGSS